jgi:hypothetical protein
MLRRGFALLLLLLLAACASPSFVAVVSVRHQLVASSVAASSVAAVKPKVFAIERNASQAQSLAQQEFESELATQLINQGYVWQKESSRDAEPIDWLVKLEYQVDDGKNRAYQQPIWGTIGYSVSYQRVISGGNIMYIPRYYPETGIVGSQLVNETIFTREVFVDIYDKQALDHGEFAKLYEGRARNRSYNDELESAVPWLIRSLFLPFPGPSGVSREVRIPLNPTQP